MPSYANVFLWDLRCKTKKGGYEFQIQYCWHWSTCFPSSPVTPPFSDQDKNKPTTSFIQKNVREIPQVDLIFYWHIFDRLAQEDCFFILWEGFLLALYYHSLIWRDTDVHRLWSSPTYILACVTAISITKRRMEMRLVGSTRIKEFNVWCKLWATRLCLLRISP